MADWRDTKFSLYSSWVQEETRRNNKGGWGGIKTKGKFRNLFELDNSFYSIPLHWPDLIPAAIIPVKHCHSWIYFYFACSQAM